MFIFVYIYISQEKNGARLWNKVSTIFVFASFLTEFERASLTTNRMFDLDRSTFPNLVPPLIGYMLINTWWFTQPLCFLFLFLFFFFYFSIGGLINSDRIIRVAGVIGVIQLLHLRSKLCEIQRVHCFWAKDILFLIGYLFFYLTKIINNRSCFDNLSF